MMMIGRDMSAAEYCQFAQQVISQLPLGQIQSLSDELFQAWEAGRTVFLCGNGGAGSTAGHFADDFSKSTLPGSAISRDDVKRLKVLSLAENSSAILAWGNDAGFDQVFVGQLRILASPGDVLIAMSGSGNSENLLRAVEWANSHGLVTWGLTGYDGGRLRHSATHSLHVAVEDMGLTQSMHMLLLHWVLDNLYGRISAATCE